MKNRLLANFALLLTALIWGLSFVAQRAGMDYIGPFTFNFVRSILGGLSLIPAILFVKLSVKDTRTEKRKHLQHINLVRAGIACGLALFTALTIQQYCMQYVGAGKAGFITALYVIFVPIISVLIGEKLSKTVVLCVFLATIGLYLLCWKAKTGFGIYDMLLLVSSFFYAIHIMVVDFYSRHTNPIKTSCLQFFVVGFLSFILTIVFETIDYNAIYNCRGPLLFAGILTCGAAYTLQIFGQKYTYPIVASLILCLESVFAVLGGVLILGETMTVKEILGCIFMITAVLLSNFKFCDNKS